MQRIYFDYNATTPLAPEVKAAMLPYLEEPYGNPSSLHWAGLRASAAIDYARRQLAALLNSQPGEVLFTSGGTEANNSALLGVFFGRHNRQSTHYIVSSIEHPSIAKTVDFLERLGAEVTRVPVDRFGLVDPDAIRQAMRSNTVLVSVMHANNEVGTLQPIREISLIAHKHGALVHTDAAQSAGKVSIDVQELGVDLLTIAGHKMYAPQGVGALYIRQGLELEPFMHGAGHEHGRRAGTENVVEIIGLGAASELVPTFDMQTVLNLRDHFWDRLQAQFGERVVLNGHAELRLPNTLNVSFPGYRGHEILARLDYLAASTGSACHAGNYEISPVLSAIGLSTPVGLGAIRFSLGRNSTYDEVEFVVESLAQIVQTP
jgi:cysteine desulfurase